MARLTKLTKKKKLLAITAAIVLLGGAAFAYWTVGGSGDGSAATSASSADVTVVQTSVVTAMEPGDAAQALSGTFANTNDGPVYVGTVTASIASVFVGGVVAVGCDATDYTLANAVITYNAEVLADDTSTWSGPTIQFNNKATNQDACKGATVNLQYVIS